MTIVRHPNLPAQYDVPDSKVSEWVAAGWIADTPRRPTGSPQLNNTARRTSESHKETS